MRIETNGYKRFAPDNGMSRLEVDSALVAIIGPNEAGKTSLLRAACRLDDDDAISDADRTRLAGIQDDHHIIEGFYQIQPDDREQLQDLFGGTNEQLTRWFVVNKFAGGARSFQVLPGLVRDRSHRDALRAAVRTLRSNATWSSVGAEDERLADEKFIELSDILADSDEYITDGQRVAITSIRDGLRESVADDGPLAHHRGETIAALDAYVAAEDADHPNDVAIQRLTLRRPRFLFFGDEQRDLRTDYELSEVSSSPPEALDNLARLAGLDLAFLHNLITSGDSGTAVDVLQAANTRLEAAFEAWSQNDMTVRFDREGDSVIRLHVSRAAGGYDRLDERSDGLRMFVSLLAVTARSNFTVPPVVLIDELERHLHYDAQADVVQLFAQQTEIPQIIYTTHSAGCLPEDLGAGIRVVHQIDGTNRSGVLNRFWTTVGETANVGFSPLLFGLGASTLAFVPVRNALLTEGATDLVLLPSLLREATGDKHVGFQIAPASSEAPAAHVAGLDREAVRVMWLVDGDTAGGDLAREVRGQLGEDRVVPLAGPGSGKVLEDLLLPSVYAQAINDQLGRSGIVPRITPERLNRVNSPTQLAAWCQENDVRVPNKMDIANRVLDLRHEFPSLLSADGARTLRELSDLLRTTFAPANQ